MSARPLDLPGPARLVLVPLLTVTAAFGVSGLVVMAIGENPLVALGVLFAGALGNLEGLGFTLYYTTGFIFTGLAVAVAYQAGLFNIGAEGQATLGGISASLVCLTFEDWPALLLLPAAILAAAAGGALWAFIPGWLQARRGSHIVITTIMFNALASTLLVYLLVNVIKRPGSQAPETRTFVAQAKLPQLHELAASIGLSLPVSPMNLALPLALAAAGAVWILLWRTRLGYAIRVVGASPPAAVYAGISPARITMLAMALSGALAGGLAVNEILGVQNRLVLEFTAGSGFVGIAVALMGRAHPVGVVLAALLFGVLYQGGTELAFDRPKITRDMIVVIQGFVILFAGGLEFGFARLCARLLAPVRREQRDG